jgi:MtN3 and saliva related transmembrane protein
MIALVGFEMNYVDLIGFLAGALTTFAYVPQIIKTWHRKSAKDLSRGWLLTAMVGSALWAVYGFIVNSYPLFIASVITVLLVMGLFCLKLRWG